MENETNCILYCPFYLDIHLLLFQKAHQIYPGIMWLSNEEKRKSFVVSPLPPKSVPLLVRAAFGGRRHWFSSHRRSSFHLFCLVFPHTWFTFPHQTKCILPSVSPHVCVWNCSLCRVLCYRLSCARFVYNLGLFVLFNPVHVTVVVLCAASPVPFGPGYILKFSCYHPSLLYCTFWARVYIKVPRSKISV